MSWTYCNTFFDHAYPINHFLLDSNKPMWQHCGTNLPQTDNQIKEWGYQKINGLHFKSQRGTKNRRFWSNVRTAGSPGPKTPKVYLLSSFFSSSTRPWRKDKSIHFSRLWRNRLKGDEREKKANRVGLIKSDLPFLTCDKTRPLFSLEQSWQMALLRSALCELSAQFSFKQMTECHIKQCLCIF